MYNINCMKQDEIYILIPIRKNFLEDTNDFVLILTNGERKKAVILTSPKTRKRKLKFYRDISWN